MKWIELIKPNAKCALRLFMCHYAGANASCFYSWIKHFSEEVEIACIQLPGRGSSSETPPLHTMEAVIEGLSTELKPWIDKIPFVFYGHSLGALVSFEFSRTLKNSSLFPEHLIISGCRAPHLPMRRNRIANLPNQEFIAELLKYNGTPKELLEHRELMEYFLPILRADFTIADNYQIIERAKPFSFPITAIGGISDPNIYESDIKEWQEYTNQEFNHYMVPGDHFFINSSKNEVINIIRIILSNTLANRN